MAGAGPERIFRKQQVERSAPATVEWSDVAIRRHKTWMILETTMRMPTRILAAAVVAAAIPVALPAAAAPLSQSLGLSNTNAGPLEQIDYRRTHRRNYRSGYYAYGSTRGFLRSEPRRWNYGNGSAATAPGSWRGCPGGDRAISDSYPSWMCR
jgi:hypothetical protein